MMIFSKNLIGLDIQTDGLRLVERSFTQGIKKLLYQPLPTQLYQDGRVADWQALGAILAKWVGSLRLSAQKTAFALPASVVRMQQMQLPVGLNASDIKAEITAQLQRDLPGLQEKLAIDFIISKANPSPSYTTVFFAATKEAVLMPYVECINAAGLAVSIVDIDLYALKRTVCKTAQSAMILQLTSVAAQLVIFKNEEVIFHEQLGSHVLLRQWLENTLTSVQHLLVSNCHVVGPADLVRHTLKDLIDAEKWQIASSVTQGFEVAVGLTMRGQV
ncbi:MAG: pilus assembly protein PilM [Gammaproteobacteria bacterium]